ncbi:tRNA(Ile)-lysidine synthase [Tamaricihabitans halophyticus]|uniref:tRNA(Ile)-lysidine synthase n=1 Tax=Tamaricihabitans halophyticus TaxID=1262583 RepID=A0A4R2R1Z3_9PSEU|nr:tRNA lysidine(34) synthetase TilS [Tamaricihabitans halophyticus]TCP56740.1 tRNA(Ile)-lysidine synthase [Tamaricihabitans halophyticus]
MAGPDPAVAAVRAAVRDFLRRTAYPATELAVAVSGGADSLALAAACAFVGPRAGLRVHGLIVDHQLQAESAAVANRAAAQLSGLGLAEVRVIPVDVHGSGGPEAAARRARYGALRAANPAPDALVLLGHTRDDQAETVLLGLGRGSGPRSLAGMRELDPPWGRPLLELPRETTECACAALDLEPWQDPHNADPRYTRVRLRHEVLPLLEQVLQGGVAAALARTATQLRDDLSALDELAEALRPELTGADGGLAVDALAAHPSAVRRRVLRGWLTEAGVRELSDPQLRAVEALITHWRGQGGVWLPGSLVARRAHGRLLVHHEVTGT